MFQLTINEKGGATRQESFEKDEVTIGRVQGNDIILPKGNISKRHSRIVLKDGKFIIVDLKSTNGTYVNGKKITAPQVIKTTDKVYIGDFTLQIEESARNGAEEPVRGLAEEEIDLFGGDAGFDPEPASPGAPGLIDQSFDQEFEAPPAPAPEPAPAPAPEPARARAPEPEPESEDLDLAPDFEASDAEPPPLELDDGFGPEPEPESPPEPPPAPSAAPSPRAPSLRAFEPVAEVEPDLEATPPPEPGPTEAPPTAMPGPSPVEPALPGPPAPPEPPEPPEPVAAPPRRPEPAPTAEPPLERAALLASVHARVAEVLGLVGRRVETLPSLAADARAAAEACLAELAGRVPAGLDREALLDEVTRRAVGVDPIADLLADESVFEVVVAADRRVLVDREGRLEPTERVLASDAEVQALVHALATLGGATPGEVGSFVDVRLRSGARVIGALPPVAFRGPSLTVRKTSRDFFTLEKLQEYDTIDAAVFAFLEHAVRHRKNILLSIGPGVTATATLNALLSQSLADERVVTVERGVELHLENHVNAVAFEGEPGDHVDDVLRHAAAAQAERVIFGELREEDAGPVVDAFSGLFEGGAAAVVARSAAEGVDRLVEWVGMHRAGGAEAVRRAVARAFPVVLQERKLSDNSRRLTEVCELTVEDDEVRLSPIFEFEPTGVDEGSMMILGRFMPRGRVPRFLEEVAERGEAEVDTSIFRA